MTFTYQLLSKSTAATNAQSKVKTNYHTLKQPINKKNISKILYQKKIVSRGGFLKFGAGGNSSFSPS